MSKRTTLGLAALGVAAASAVVFRRELAALLLRLPPPLNTVGVERDIRIIMPDGVALLADHYYPKAAGEFPTILIRSGYGREYEAGWFGRAFAQLLYLLAERGYHVVMQTTRGRFHSEGEFRPLLAARADGQATLEWIARQPWFDGRAGMWGSSWLGYMQWAAAVGGPPFLKAIVPTITASQFYGFSFPDGAFGLDSMLRWLVEINVDGVPGKPPSRRRWQEVTRALDKAFLHLPVAESDTLAVGEPVPFFRETLEHPRPDDPFWGPADLSGQLATVQAPAHLITGWYDLFLRETVADYAALQAAGHAPYLTIGPWYHIHPGVVLESVREGLIWFDAYLKGNRARLRALPVRVHVMGANEWRDLEAWPPPSLTLRYYVHAEHRLALAQPAAETPPDRYRYDPADPTPAVGGPVFSFGQSGPMDNRTLEARPDVWCYTAPKLDSDLEVMGTPRVTLYVRSSLPTTDFFVRICDVRPGGRSLNVTDGLLRIEPGAGTPQPDGSLRVEIAMWPTAFRFRRGHRIRLQVSSGAHPRWCRNLGSGEPVGSGTRMLAAEQEVYHDGRHPSALVLPVTAGATHWRQDDQVRL